MGDFIGAVDQGTTSTRFMVFDHDGNEVAQAPARARADPAPGRLGRARPHRDLGAHPDGDRQRRSASAGSQARDLAAIGDHQPARDDGRLGPADRPAATTTPSSGRTPAPTRIAAALDARRPRRRHPAARPGCRRPPTSPAGKVQWILENVDGLRDAAERGDALFGTIDTLGDLEPHRRRPTAASHVTDVTNASRTMLMDLQTLDWDDELLGFFGIPRAMLPDDPALVSDASAYGTTTADGPLRRGGADHRRPRRPAGGDGRPGLLRARRGEEHLRHRQLHAAQHRRRSWCAARAACSRRWPTGSATRSRSTRSRGRSPSPGRAVQWLRDQLGIISGAAEVEALAASVEDTGGVYFVPAFSGLFAPYWRSDARGAIVGLSRFNTNAHLARATLEAICYQTRDVVDAMATDSGVAPRRCLKVDGGVTANASACSCRPTSSACRSCKPVVAETTALGAAYAAGLATGLLEGHRRAARQLARGRALGAAVDRRAARTGMPGGRRPCSAPWAGWTRTEGTSIRMSSALSPEARQVAIDTMASGEELDVLVIGGGVVGAGARSTPPPAACASAWSRRATSPAAPRRRSSKLIHGGLRYLEMLDFGLVREALRERGLMLHRLAPHLVQAGAVPLPADPPRCGSAPYVGAGHRRSTTPWRRGGTARRAAAPPAPDPAPAPRLVPASRSDALVGAHPVLRRPGRRRPAHDDARPDCRRTTAPVSPRASAVVGFLREGERVTGVRAARPQDRGDEFEGPRPAGRQRDRGVDRRHPGDGRRARPVPASAPPRASTSSCRATASTSTHWHDPAHREVACCSSSRGAGTGSSARPTPTGTSTRPTLRPRATDIDYLLEQVNQVLATPLTHERHRGRVRRAAAAAGRRERRRRRQAVPGARVVAPGARPGRRRRRQVHDLPGDGQGRRRRGRRAPWTATVAALDDRRRSPLLGARRLQRDVEPAPQALAPRGRPARRADRAPAQPLRRR